MTDAKLEALMRATMTEGYPSDVRRLVDAVQAAEREHWERAAHLQKASYEREIAIEVEAERERCADLCWDRRGHFASDAAARAFAELVRKGRPGAEGV